MEYWIEASLFTPRRGNMQECETSTAAVSTLSSSDRNKNDLSTSPRDNYGRVVSGRRGYRITRGIDRAGGSTSQRSSKENAVL